MSAGRAATDLRRTSPTGLWLTVLGADALEALPLGRLGWLGVDLQHGCLEVGDLAGILRVSPVPVLARAGSQDAAHLARVLDTGVHGVVVPGVGSAQEAAALVRAVRPPPEGRRSTGASRSALVAGPARPLLLPMVETAEGLADAAGIAATPGVDGVFVGPYDLALSLGLPSVLDDGLVRAVHDVARAAREAGVLAGAFSGSRELDARLPDLDLLAVDADVALLRAGLDALLG